MAQYLSLSRLETQLSLEPSELYFLQARVIQLEAEISNLTEEIDTHESGASVLIPRKKAKILQLNLLKNILAPIRRIPLEILGYIFELSCLPRHLPGQPRLYPGLDHNCIRSPVTTSKVCTAWRQVAHRTPWIWSNLIINVNNPKHLAALGNDVSWVKDWLARSQSVPLEIRLEFLTWEERILADRVKSGISQLLNHCLSFCHKIQVLALKSQSASLHLFISLPPSSFPILESLTLSFEERNEDNQSTNRSKRLADIVPHPIQAFVGATKLQTVIISEASEAISLFQLFALPMGQVTSLAVSGKGTDISTQVYLDLFLQCEALTTFRFIPSESIDFTMIRFPRLFWPTLTSLTIMCYRESCGGDLFDCLTAPSLQELALSWYTEDSYQDLSTRLISFQARSAPNKLSSIELRVFNATDAGEHFENLILALRAFPAVESFFLADSYPSGWDILFQDMTCLNGPLDVLFPKLTTLSLILSSHGMTEYPRGLNAMILSRQPPLNEVPSAEANSGQTGVRQLQKLTLKVKEAGMFSLKDVAFLSELGLDVNMSSY